MQRPAAATWAFLLVALLVPFGLPSSTADHPSHQNSCTPEEFFHLCVDVQDLEPGASLERRLMSPEGPLRAGWVYIVYGGVVSGNSTVNATLEGPNGTVETFTWTRGLHRGVTKIQDTGNHTLILTNTGNESARYAFYYDQSCNCAGKLIPLTNGFVLFNYEFDAGHEVYLGYPLAHSCRDGATVTSGPCADEQRFPWSARAHLAAYDTATPTARWPEDFTVLSTVEATAPDWLNFTFTPSERGLYFVFIEDLGTASHTAPLTLSPLIEVDDEDEADAPGTASALLITGALLMLGLARRRARQA